MEVKDGACMDVCPVDCIYESIEQMFINPDECIDCGACVPACPEPPCSAHPTYSSSLKNIYEQHIVHKAVWGDLATRGRVRIFTALNKNNGYERVTEHPERS
jgi:Fe-S-cluster-containing hydrogenase component 2